MLFFLNPQKMRRYLYEWLAAVVMYETTGHFSLQQKYQFKHKKKRETLNKLGASELIEFFEHQKEQGYGGLQAPDLLVYQPDHVDYYFCEVKGPTDRLRKEQERYFRALEEVTGKSVYLFHVTEMAAWAG